MTLSILFFIYFLKQLKKCCHDFNNSSHWNILASQSFSLLDSKNPFQFPKREASSETEVKEKTYQILIYMIISHPKRNYPKRNQGKFYKSRIQFYVKEKSSYIHMPYTKDQWNYFYFSLDDLFPKISEVHIYHPYEKK